MNPEIARRVSNGVCAFVVTYNKGKTAEEQTVIQVKSFGTGFLVSPRHVLTTRRTLEKLDKGVSQMGRQKGDRKLQFSASMQFNSISGRLAPIDATLRADTHDLALVRLDRPISDDIAGCGPLDVQSKSDALVGDPIGIAGHPFGERLVETKDGRAFTRFGPVLQRGWISGILPTNESAVVARYVLDARVAEGMQGSPVFQIDTGVVIGILDAMENWIAGLAAPINRTLVNALIGQLDATKTPGSFSVSGLEPVMRNESAKAVLAKGLN